MSKKKRPQVQQALVSKVTKETKDTSTLFLNLPIKFEWEPGQFIMIGAEIDGKNVRRAYSIASPPTRERFMEITVRQTETPTMSKFLNEVKEGDMLNVRGPYGKFIWNEQVNKKVVMLAAGSGITPFKAFLEYIEDKQLDVRSKLFYSCGYGDNVIFEEYLDALTSSIPNCEYELSLTRETCTKYNGRRGRINKEYLLGKITEFEDAHFYICGAPGFVKAMIATLEEIGIDKPRIKREQWG